MSAVRVAWHYTIGNHADRIVAGGLILPATTFVPEGEKPCVWFSTRQHWEPTATKGIVGPDGVRQNATMQEMLTLGGGLARFGLPVADLIGWRDIQHMTGMSRETARTLAKVARLQGADPAFWFGSLEPVPVSRCEEQRFTNGAWMPVNEIRGAA